MSARMPRWARIVLWILLIWAVLFVVWFFLGQVKTEEASAAEPPATDTVLQAPAIKPSPERLRPGERPATEADVRSLGIDPSALQSAVSTMAATAESCPDYVLVSNPATGGTATVDRCANGRWPYNGWDGLTLEDSATAVASGNNWPKCRTADRRVNFKNNLGWTMFWLYMQKSWCYGREGRIKSAASPFVNSGVTTFGSSMQWRREGSPQIGNETAGDYSWHHSWAIQRFRRCVPAPWGCIEVGDVSPAIHIFGYGNGGVSY